MLGGKALSSMDDLREGYLKRERESRGRLLVMSSWPDDGALVMRWKKAIGGHRTKLSNILYPDFISRFYIQKARKNDVFLKLVFSVSLSI